MRAGRGVEMVSKCKICGKIRNPNAMGCYKCQGVDTKIHSVWCKNSKYCEGNFKKDYSQALRIRKVAVDFDRETGAWN
jgi:hypothetical protein